VRGAGERLPGFPFVIYLEDALGRRRGPSVQQGISKVSIGTEAT
jgi:hypothetical protein